MSVSQLNHEVFCCGLIVLLRAAVCGCVSPAPCDSKGALFIPVSINGLSLLSVVPASLSPQCLVHSDGSGIQGVNKQRREQEQTELFSSELSQSWGENLDRF